MKATDVLAALDVRSETPAPATSDARFPDGGAFRIEIPSVEGPRALSAVLAAADEHGIIINRISQGSGAMLHTLSELRDMVGMVTERGIALALFVGPRAEWDIGGFSRSEMGAAQSGALRGMRGLEYAVEDVFRAVEEGVRSFLVADLGLLSVLSNLRARSELPAECLWKVSAYIAPSNPATLRVLEQLGADTINVVSDVSEAELADMRRHVELPLDLYLETPDSMGGIVRGNEIASLIRVGAPLHVKFGLRNAPPAYPGGSHTADVAVSTGRERVRRAAIAIEWLARTDPTLVQSRPESSFAARPVNS